MLKITVITVVYNAAEDLEKTILSVVDQDYNNIEYVVIDGFSTDSTLDIIKKYSDSIDNYISERDSGIYDAMNKGINLSTGEYLIFMNAGDVFYDNHVVSSVAISISEMAIYYGKAMFVSRSNQWIYKRKATRLSLTRKNICHQTAFYPRQLFVHNGAYDTNYSILADWAFNIKAYNYIPFIYLDIIICKFDTNGLSFSSKKDECFLNDLPILIKQHLGLFAYSYYFMRRVVATKLLSRYRYSTLVTG